MNKYKAATILKNTLEKTPESFTEEGKEALEEGILALYKEHCHKIGSAALYALQCAQCQKPILLQAETREYDSDDRITTFSAKCPYCGKNYEWNDCYWR